MKKNCSKASSSLWRQEDIEVFIPSDSKKRPIYALIKSLVVPVKQLLSQLLLIVNLSQKALASQPRWHYPHPYLF